MVLEAGAFLLVTTSVVRHAVADWAAKTGVVDNLRLAVRLDPGHSYFQLQLARQLQYNLQELNPQGAITHLVHALKLNPYDPQPWLELAAAVGFENRPQEAMACLLEADYFAPNLPGVQWPIGNLFLLQGNNQRAFRHFKMVLSGTNKYDGIAFRTAWKASGDADLILTQLIPGNVSTQMSYLYYLVDMKNFEAAQKVWKLIARNPQPFPPIQLSEYFNSLITARRLAEAQEVWGDLRGKGLIPATYQPTQENQLQNGDFEQTPLNIGFDWRLVPFEGVQPQLDQTTFHSPSHSVVVSFPGDRNVEFRHVFQYVRVQPGHAYRLQGFMKTEGITTDSGARLEVRDPYDATLLDVRSEDLRGSSEGWMPLLVDFKTSPKTELISVAVARVPSRKLDNQIAGRVWLDDVTLTPLSAEPGSTP